MNTWHAPTGRIRRRKPLPVEERRYSARRNPFSAQISKASYNRMTGMTQEMDFFPYKCIRVIFKGYFTKIITAETTIL